ncbi:MAG: hypothetical protein A2161_21380 [Candidatus Schekmanbacteria bacterium RBG_13_48_7]|uniref:DUF7948 domain-containing protein n=1 Tax=Candidatus Schekmanbacteria bacterium RBG_13_48_7 TaxID=1817878 RepID=A0A1F7RUL7_9BACT|nr:MAG: hypothetical protein A2161_21380 [Candidatus Schekmanbacteria bacterium RBG_13_48_7]
MKIYSGITISLAILLFVCICTGNADDNPNPKGVSQANVNLSKIVPSFIENQGQINNETVRFYLTVPGKTIFLTNNGIVLDFYQNISTDDENSPRKSDKRKPDLSPEINKNEPEKTQREGMVIKKEFIGAGNAVIKGLEKMEGKVNYFIGGDKSKWKTGLPTYQQVLYEGIYNNINLRYISSPGKLKYQFEIGQSGNPNEIKVQVTGCDDLVIDKDSNLIMKTSKGDIVDQKPYTYQLIDNKTVEIDSHFIITDKFNYSFFVGNYNTEYPLIIDPAFLYESGF